MYYWLEGETRPWWFPSCCENIQYLASTLNFRSVEIPFLVAIAFTTLKKIIKQSIYIVGLLSYIKVQSHSKLLNNNYTSESVIIKTRKNIQSWKGIKWTNIRHVENIVETLKYNDLCRTSRLSTGILLFKTMGIIIWLNLFIC